MILNQYLNISDSAQVFASSVGGPIRSSVTKQQETSTPAGHAVYQGSFTSGTCGMYTCYCDKENVVLSSAGKYFFALVEPLLVSIPCYS